VRHPVRSLLVALCLCALPRLAAASECALPDPGADTDFAACDRLDYESPYVVDILGDEPMSPPAGTPAHATMLETAPCPPAPDLRACPAAPAPRHLHKLPAVKLRVVRLPQQRPHHQLAAGSIGDDEPGVPPASPPAPISHGSREVALPSSPPPLMPPGAARFALGHASFPQTPPAARLERPPRAV
jgi:hypothetical protein